MATTQDPSNEEAVTYLDVEEAARESLSVHWRAVFAGLFISMLAYFTLVSLGLGIGAGQMRDVLAGQDALGNIGIGAAIWLAVTVLISLFVGSYASSRSSGIIATRVGAVQGAVITALFFTLMTTQAGIALGTISSGLGAIRDTLSGAAWQMGNNPRLTAIVDDALGDMDLKSSPETVGSGVLSRLMRGDTDSAITYLANQSGLTRAEAEVRYQQLSGQVQAAAAEIGQRTATAARTIGWTAFGLMVFGTLFAILGGTMGAQLNIRKPISELDRKALRMQRPAYV
ncbi:MAG: hypothetical protein KF799_12430 [Bdellovibrionales bacterium]|nr:hypothetical protein [Bdellovibrionales bacterium]